MIGKKTRSLRLAVALSATLGAHRGYSQAATIASRAVSVNDTGHLHLLKAFGSVLLEEGAAAGTLPGLAKVRLHRRLDGHRLLHDPNQIRDHLWQRTRSVALLRQILELRRLALGDHGTGSYAHAHGSGKLYGVIDRRTSSLTVQTVGTLSY